MHLPPNQMRGTRGEREGSGWEGNAPHSPRRAKLKPNEAPYSPGRRAQPIPTGGTDNPLRFPAFVPMGTDIQIRCGLNKTRSERPAMPVQWENIGRSRPQAVGRVKALPTNAQSLKGDPGWWVGTRNSKCRMETFDHNALKADTNK